MSENGNKAYEAAQKVYSLWGVDTEKAIKSATKLPLSIHCWQGDDVVGFEGASQLNGGGILATGNYPGRARNGDELRADAEKLFSFVPGTKRFSLHALYAETEGKPVPRDQLEPAHFKKWIAWAKKQKIGLDYNGSFFAHPLSEAGWTLSSPDKKTREFWIRHAIGTRKIAAAFGKELKTASNNNLWIPDGSKDLLADRWSPRQRLAESLDRVQEEKISEAYLVDSLESKLFGIGSEAYVVGSHEFYLGYAVKNKMHITLDMGHFHVHESIADKLSSLLLFLPGLFFHVSRGVRWDSDHVPLWTDEVTALAQEVVRMGQLDRFKIGTDFFDASINRLMAWTIGARSTQKAFLYAFLEPIGLLREVEKAGRFGERLALLEEFKSLPHGAVWDEYCRRSGVPVGREWLEQAKSHEVSVLKTRQ